VKGRRRENISGGKGGRGRGGMVVGDERRGGEGRMKKCVGGPALVNLGIKKNGF